MSHMEGRLIGVVWKQVKVAASNKTTKKSTTRAPRGLYPSFGRRRWAADGPQWLPSGPQVAPKLGPWGCKKDTKPNGFRRFVVWKQVKVAASNRTTKKSNRRARRCSWSFGAPPEEPQEAPKWGPRASPEEPYGVQKRYKNQCFFNDS